MAVRLLIIELNWRNDLSNLPSAATGRRKRNGQALTACLREPMFVVVLLVRFPLLVAAEGFFVDGFNKVLSGGFGSGSCLAFLARKNRTRTLARNRATH